MSSDQQDARKTAYRTELQVEFRRLVQRLDDATEARVADGDRVSVAELAALEQSVLSMRTQMLPLIQGQKLLNLWDEFELDRPPAECAIEETTTGTHGETGIDQTKRQTHHAPLHRLQLWAHGLMRLYSELGFAPRRDETDSQTKIDADLLEEVDAWRRKNVG